MTQFLGAIDITGYANPLAAVMMLVAEDGQMRSGRISLR
jgi:hypothetical protein